MQIADKEILELSKNSENRAAKSSLKYNLIKRRQSDFRLMQNKLASKQNVLQIRKKGVSLVPAANWNSKEKIAHKKQNGNNDDLQCLKTEPDENDSRFKGSRKSENFFNKRSKSRDYSNFRHLLTGQTIDHQEKSSAKQVFAAKSAVYHNVNSKN